jgi:hypothetical protein
MNVPTPRVLRSTLAVLLGMISVFALSLGTDHLLHVLEVYPPWGQPMYAFWLNVLALAYRVIFNIFGGFLTARLAPHNRMRHAMIYGWIGFGLSIVGALVAIWIGGLGPVWYPVLLALSALPCAWVGGRLGSK